MASELRRVWIPAARPKTLPAAAAPVLMGTAMAYGASGLHLGAASLALLGALLLQIGTNYANDYFDARKGADTEARRGPTRATASGLVAPTKMRNAFVLMFALAFAAGIFLVMRGGWPVVVIGLTSIAFGVLYTGGPFALAYLGIADVFVMVFFGCVAVAGTYYVQTLTIDTTPILAGVGPGALAVALLTVNNLRDRETDLEARKRTLVVRLGRRFGQCWYAVNMLVALAVPIVLWLAFDAPWLAAALTTGVMLVFAPPPLRAVLAARPGDHLGPALGGTGRLLVVYGLAFSMGWVLS